MKVPENIARLRAKIKNKDRKAIIDTTKNNGQDLDGSKAIFENQVIQDNSESDKDNSMVSLAIKTSKNPIQDISYAQLEAEALQEAIEEDKIFKIQKPKRLKEFEGVREVTEDDYEPKHKFKIGSWIILFLGIAMVAYGFGIFDTHTSTETKSTDSVTFKCSGNECTQAEKIKAVQLHGDSQLANTSGQLIEITGITNMMITIIPMIAIISILTMTLGIGRIFNGD